jgi:hypothetical protein
LAGQPLGSLTARAFRAARREKEMTIITYVLRQVLRLLGIVVKHALGALRTRIETIRWRRNILRSLDARRRG